MEHTSLHEIVSKYERMPPNKARNANEELRLRNNFDYFHLSKGEP